MSIDKNIATARRYIDEVWNKGNLAALREVAAPNVVVHFLPKELPKGIAGYEQFVKMYRAGFPDLHFVIDDVIADGDKVVMRWTVTGTHKGQFLSFAPTFRKGTVTGISIEHYDDQGRMVESWLNFDQLGMFQQLGLVPVLA